MQQVLQFAALVGTLGQRIHIQTHRGAGIAYD
jgi:hypothetical protein